MRHSFSNKSEVAHAWAHRTSTHGRAGNVYFDGDTIYSYGSHFAIARWLDADTVAFTTRDYSQSTSSHKSEVRSAIPHGTRIIYVPYPERSAAAQAESVDEAARATLEGAVKRRKEELRNWDMARAVALVDNFNAYAEKTGSGVRLRSLQGVDFATVRAEVARREAEMEERERRAAEERLDRQRRRLARMKSHVAAWRRCARDLYGKGYAERIDRSVGDLLRVNPGNRRVEATSGLSITFEEAVSIWRIVRACRERGRRFHDRHGSAEWGRVTVHPDGRVQIGCHDIAPKEVDYAARRLRELGVLDAESDAPAELPEAEAEPCTA